MTSPHYARLASKVLEELDSAPPPPAATERARTVAALARAITGRARRRRRIRWAGAGVATAVVAVSVLFGRHVAFQIRGLGASPEPVSPVAKGGDRPAGSGGVAPNAPADLVHLDNGSAVPAGSRVVTPSDGHATLSFSSGTSVLLHEATDVIVAAEGAAQVIRLEAGSVELHVAKLAADQRFLVDTPDSEVEVRGTRFRVSIRPPDARCDFSTMTRVLVAEGVVVVRHGGSEVRLGAGDQWPAHCVRDPAVPQTAQKRASAPARSTLADQNDLFAAAVSAKRGGDSSAALLAFERFLATYPNSPLVESAVVERMRLMREVAPARSAAAANEYLAQYPNGYAHSEAEAIIAGGP